MTSIAECEKMTSHKIGIWAYAAFTLLLLPLLRHFLFSNLKSSMLSMMHLNGTSTRFRLPAIFITFHHLSHCQVVSMFLDNVSMSTLFTSPVVPDVKME